MAATITTRKVDPVTGEPLFGSGQANFISDKYAVAQIILMVLRLLFGEWWENLQLGTPLFQKILGANTSVAAISALLQQIIQSCPYVVSISNVSAVQTNNTLAYSCKVLTTFGTVLITNSPGSNAKIAS